MPEPEEGDAVADDEEVVDDGIDLGGADEGYQLWVTAVALCVLVSVIPLTILYGDRISVWVVPTLIVGFVGFALSQTSRG